MNVRSIDLIKKHFGQDAEFHRDLFGVVHVSSRYGQVEFKKQQFENLIGGSDLYRAVLLFSAESWGSVRVSGNSDHILACMAHGKQLGLNVIPLGNAEGSGCLALGCAFVAFAAALLAGAILMLFQVLHGIEPLDLGAVAALVTGLITYPFIKKALAKDARKGGQRYRDVFPEIHGSDRQARRDAARERGLM
jgi:hypothetical protein